MSTPLAKDENDEERWDDVHARREEFRRRLAERGIFVRLPRTDKEWIPPVPLPISADEASAMVIRMREED